MFKFRFSDDAEHETAESSNSTLQWVESKEIEPVDEPMVKYLLKNVSTSTLVEGDFVMKYFKPKDVIEALKKAGRTDSVLLNTDQDHLDLLPSVYEGGLKIWECTYDLLKFFGDSNIDFKGKRVLDLGCGAGVLGIYMIQQGAQGWFQDYNEEVIKYLTIPNILVNYTAGIPQNCKFFCGDWQSFLKFSGEGNIDYIVTSETIYNTGCYSKLHSVFERFLKEEGVIFLAAKYSYFGVGGGIPLFQNYLNDQKIFKSETCWEHSVGVKRAILKITRIK